MMTIRNLSQNTLLSEEEHKHIDEKIRFSASKRAFARQVVPTRNITNKLTYEYTTGTDMGAAAINYVLSEAGDIVNLVPTVKKIPAIWKDFTLDQRTYTSDAGPAAILRNAENAAKQIAEEEDTLAFDGYIRTGTTYEINGMYNGAGNDFSTTRDFATAGYPLAAVTGGLALMAADGIDIGGRNIHLLLHPTQYGEILASVHTGGVREYNAVNELLGGTPTEPHIHLCNDMAAAKGLLVTRDEEYVELVVAQDITTISRDVKGDFWMRAYEYVLPVIYDADALCKLSSI